MTRTNLRVTIKYFKKLQKYYQRTYNDKEQKYVSNALECMNLYYKIKDVLEEYAKNGHINLRVSLCKDGTLVVVPLTITDGKVTIEHISV